MTKVFKYLFVALFFLTIITCSRQYPQVEFKTSLGSFIVEIYSDEAPVSAENFLKYVRENRYNDGEFYRVVTIQNQTKDSIKIEVIQGGLWADEHPDRLPAIEHENTQQTGILHKDGIISMARSQPGSAADAFFICIGDQPQLDYGGKRNPDGQGFAAFGKVINGMAVVMEIQKQKETNQYLQTRIPFKVKELF